MYCINEGELVYRIFASSFRDIPKNEMQFNILFYCLWPEYPDSTAGLAI